MTIRLVNDDPRCKYADNCKATRVGRTARLCRFCGRTSKIELMRARTAALRKRAWSCQRGHEAMYTDLVKKLGSTEARRLVLEHVRIKAAHSA